MRTKYNPEAGPDGGDGGRGGHIILRGNSQLWTLLHLRYYKNVVAEDGANGRDNNSTGHNGEDVIIEVPLGTQAFDEETGEMEVEILHDGQEVIWIPGGQGGRGNAYFKSSTNQTPEYSQPGMPGREGWKALELKMLADVGLVGFPNAGKSTLLSTITAAKPKIADYAFTTLTPNLGMVAYRNDRSFCIADLPGIIEGAHEGKGVGDRFLRHIERTKLLLHLVDVSSVSGREAATDYETVNHELASYNRDLATRPQFVVATKIDALDEPERLESLKQRAIADDKPFFAISSATGEGVRELVNAMAAKLEELNAESKRTDTVELAL